MNTTKLKVHIISGVAKKYPLKLLAVSSATRWNINKNNFTLTALTYLFCINRPSGI